MKIKQWLSKIPVFNTAAAAIFAASLYYGGLDILKQKAPEPEEVSYSEFMHRLGAGEITDITINRETFKAHFSFKNQNNQDGYTIILPRDFDGDQILEKSSNTSLTFTDGGMSDEEFNALLLFILLVASGSFTAFTVIDKMSNLPIKNKVTPQEPEDLEQLRSTAYHEAGHAIIGLVLQGTVKINYATIIPQGDTLGHVSWTRKGTYCFSKSQFMNHLALDFGGMAAEQIIYGENKGGVVGDLSRATAQARQMISEMGMGEKTGLPALNDTLTIHTGNNLRHVLANISGRRISNETLREIELETREILDEALELATKTLNKHRAALDEVAQTLLEKKTLQADDIQAIVDKHKPSVPQAVPLVDIA
jgi:ATP-dependent Zn protease